MEMESEKRAFAQALINGMDAGKAAFHVFPSDSANRMKAILHWEKDADVIEITKEILGVKNKAKELPTKEEHIEELYEIFRDDELAPRDRLSASDQIARMQGFITEKKEQNTTINNKIMVVTKSLNDSEWEEKARRNQENLMKGIIEVKAIDVTDDTEDK